jgi:hypothetical protein
VIQKLLSISMFPLLLASTQLKLTEGDLQNNRDYYEVINATTGEKIEEKLYTKEERLIETHIAVVSAIKKALANQGVAASTVKVLLYYEGLAIKDSWPPRMWQNKPHPDTITSPWLDLTKTVTNSGETRITIRIDATAARLMSDLYSQPEDKSNASGFLSIPSIKSSCFDKIIYKYELAILTFLGRIPPVTQDPKEPWQDAKEARNESRKSFDCAPEELREPLMSLIKSSAHSGIGLAFGGLDFTVPSQLFDDCQDEAEKYYSELYPQIVVRGLQILESELNSEPGWWTEIIDQIEPIQKCQR